MNDVPGPNGAASPQPQSMDFATDQAVENAAIAGAAAVQKLVAERNELRNRMAAQEHEVAAYRAVNTDLRRRLILVHRHYVELAKKVVGDLEGLDGKIREIAQEAHPGQDPRAQDPRGAHPAQELQQGQEPQQAQDLTDAQALPFVEATEEAASPSDSTAALKAALNGSAQAKS